MNEIVVTPPAFASSRIAFANNRGGFRRLVMRGAMLEFVTVGFYRFWLATDIRRHLWSHTSIDGDVAEYTGTGKELLIGFLFAIAILAPVYLLYFIAGLEAERLQAFASFPLALFFYLFMQFAIYRARRYRLTRTVWRGVRFAMVGSGWNYAWRAMLWSLLTLLTLGLALPWRQAALERFKMRHTSYGELKGRFDGKGSDLFKHGWWLWLIALLIVVVPGGGAALLAWKNFKVGAGVLGGLTPFVVMIAMPFIYGMYKAIEWRWWLSGVRLGAVSFSSDLRRGALFGLYWKVIGWGILIGFAFSIVVTIIGGLAALLFGLSGGTTSAQKFATISQSLPVLIAGGLGYVCMALAYGMVLRIYLTHDLWRRVAESVRVIDLTAAENVTAQGQLVGALGEGFADSLDVVGF